MRLCLGGYKPELQLFRETENKLSRASFLGGSFNFTVLLEKAPGEQRGEAVKHTGGQVEDGAEAGLQSCGTAAVDHHHLVNLFWIFMSQEGAERHTRQKEQQAGYRTD